MISYYENEPLPNPVMAPDNKQPNTIVDLNNPTPSVAPLTDEDIFDFGNKHKGQKLKNVPASYLHWFYTNVSCYTTHTKAVLAYIQKNINALKKEHRDGIWQRPSHLVS